MKPSVGARVVAKKSEWVRDGDRPAWIVKCQVGGPKQFTHVEPKRAARHKNSFRQANCEKFALCSLMISLPPDSHQPHPKAQCDKWHRLREPARINRLFLEPQDQEQRRRQRAGGCLAEKRKCVEKQREHIIFPHPPGSLFKEPGPREQG